MHPDSTLHIADKVKTVITIETPRQLNYVLIDEKRAAALEPADGRSGYRYGKGFGYYQSVRDAGYHFFVEKIPSGISTIEYETVVVSEGRFFNGLVSLQCMYQPAVKVYGAGQVLEVVGK
jgi:alpha-2-macroglobulin